MNLTPNASLVVAGAGTALFVVQIGVQTEFPMTKTDVKFAAEKTEITGSFSVSPNPPAAAPGFPQVVRKIFKEFGEGATGATITWQSYWRTGQIVAPLDMYVGNTYNIRPYVRRPGWNGAGDLGSFFDFNLFIDDNSLSLEPKTGVIEWSVSTTMNGAPIGLPT